MPAYVDVRLPGMLFRQRRLVVNDEGLTWGRKAVRFDRVTALACHCIERRVVGRTATRGCEIWLYSGKKRVHIAFRAGSEPALGAYDTTREALRTHVETRLVGELLAAIEAGDVVKVQSLQLSREGLTLGRSLVPWPDVVGLGVPA
jgi:hypothetical protein